MAGYRELSVVRAVRQPLYWAREPLRRLGARPDYLTDRDWWRGFERVAAVVLSLYVLAALVGIGVLLGALIVVEWPRLF